MTSHLMELALIDMYVGMSCGVCEAKGAYRIAGKFGGFKIWRICPKMYLAVFKFGGSAPYNYYCTMNLIIICLTVCAKD